MPLYNFTVRAEDNAGAFADRDFSINVRNTVTDKFVIATGSTGAYSSVDGVTWVSRPSPLGQEVAYGGGKWINHSNGAAGIQSYWVSSDAINWAQYTTPASVDTTQSGAPLAYGNGMWMMMAGGDGSTRVNVTAYVSNDGVTWVQKGSLPTGTAIAHGRLAYGGGRWMLTRFGSGTTTTGAWTSLDDGVTWSAITFPSATNTTDAIYVNGMWVITDANGSGGIWTSIDAVNWMKRTPPGGSTSYYPINISYGNGIFYVAAKTAASTNGGWVSTDTVNWTSVNSGLASATVDINTGGCAFAGGKFITTRAATNPAWSRDGVTWTQITTLPAGTRYSVAGVAVG